MSKLILVLVALLAVSQAASFRPSVADLELLVSTNGPIPLTFIQGGGYVLPVDLSKNAKVSQNFVLSLYSSNMMFSNGCFDFKTYPCDKQYDFCQKDTTKTVSYTFPTFTAEGALLKTKAFVDYSSFALSQDAPAFLATNCKSELTAPFGAGVSGVIGLGFDGTAENNFMNMVSTFAINYNNGFKLTFNPAISGKPSMKVRTDKNWRVPTVQAFRYQTLNQPLPGYSLIFDINQDAIGMPTELYVALVGHLGNYGVNCQQFYNTPECFYNGSPNFLPDLEFVIDNDTIIKIKASMYAINPTPGKFVLNLKALSPNLKGINYVTSDYSKTIILGSSVFGGFTTVFNTNDRSVSFF